MSSAPKADQPPETPQPTFHDSVDWELRQGTPVRRCLNTLERISLFFEKPIGKFLRQPVFNPLYHTGTITTFLLLVVLVTGAYLTFFYQFGFDSSYQAVLNIEANFVGRIMRALHRYASGTAVLTALLHGWRTFFQDRFRGPRWLAWISGVGMAAVVWFIGITGYWLIWDERAYLLNQTLYNILENSQVGVTFLVDYLVSAAATTGWKFVIIIITLHLGLSALVGLFYWWHIKRLSRPKLLPPRYWIGIIAGLLVLFAMLVPVGMLPQASFESVASEVPIDLFFLFYLPAVLDLSPWIFWPGMILLIAVISAVPWLLVRRPLPPILVSEERCTGCTLCAADCPYKAITMIPRIDDSAYKFIVQVDPGMCVSCGVCIGSCPTYALTLGARPAESLWDVATASAAQNRNTSRNVIFACERHAFQGVLPFMDDHDIQVVPVTCVGMIHPNLLAKTLDAGAAAVHVVGCPPEDCANREGNRILQERLDGNRKPVLHFSCADAPISTHWLPPNEFADALKMDDSQGSPTAYNFSLNNTNWKEIIPALFLLAVILALQILVSSYPYQPAIAQRAGLEIVMNHRPGYPLQRVTTGLEPEPGVDADTQLTLAVDGETLLDESYTPRGAESRSKIFERFSLPPGEHIISLTMFDREDSTRSQTLVDRMVDLDSGQILVLNFEDTNVGGDPLAGKKLYNESSLGTNASCRICHSLVAGENTVAPSFAGIATRAGERIPGMSAEDYLRQSILDPDAYVVEDYPAGRMVPNLGETLTDAQVDDLVAFLMTLK